MREQLGIKQNVSAAELEEYKKIDPNGTCDIKIKKSPRENLNEGYLKQVRLWATLFLPCFVIITLIENHVKKSSWDYAKGLTDFIYFLSIAYSYISKSDLRIKVFAPTLAGVIRCELHLLFAV